MDYSNIPTGLKITSQIPLDVKEYCLNEATLAYLGPSNNLAFTYHDGLKVYCLEEKTIWEWREITIEPADSGLIVTGDFTYPNNSPITFGVDYSNKTYNFFKIEYQNLSDVKVYDATSVGTGETIYKNKTVSPSGNNVTFNFKEISTNNIGSGIGVINGATTSGDDIVISGKTLKTTNLSITETIPGEIVIDAPTDPSDIKFYVNANYQGGNSNGSLARPYVTLKEAYDRYIGTGDVASPQFATIGTIELLSDVETGQTGDPDEIGYLSANSLRIKGNGYKITYRGTKEYFISTAYLITQVGLDGSNALNKNISMSFEDLTITSNTVHEIVEHKNYTSPSATSQNTCSMIFRNCVLEDQAYLQELGSYTTLSGVTVFGVPVKYQTALASDKYLVRTEDLNWTGEGLLILENVTLKPSSSTAIYAKNTKCFWKNVEINFNPFFVNSGGIVSTKCTPKNDVFSIFVEGTVISQNYFRIENYTSQVQYGIYNSQQAGGQGAIIKTLDNCFVEIFKGFVYFETMTNVFLISKDTLMSLRSFDGSNIISLDATYGAFKLSGSIPGAPVFIDVNLSTINNVKNWTTLQYIRPTAASATINGAYFSDKPDFPDNALAIAGGLVPGNEYYDTTGQIATRVV